MKAPLTILLLLISMHLQAQTWHWSSYSYVLTDMELLYVDSEDNSYISSTRKGTFKHTDGKLMPSPGNGLAKLNKAGKLIWFTQLPGLRREILKEGPDGYLYLFASYSNDRKGKIGNITLKEYPYDPFNSFTIFSIFKFDKDGNGIDYTELATTKEGNVNVYAEDIIFDDNGAFFIGASIAGELKTNSGVIKKGGGFVLKYNANRECVWLRAFGSHNQGNCRVRFSWGKDKKSFFAAITSSTENWKRFHISLYKFNRNGKTLDSIYFGGGTSSIGNFIVDNENIYLSGGYHDSLIIRDHKVINELGSFIMKMDTAFNVIWLHNYNSLKYDFGAICLDPRGYIAATGATMDSTGFYVDSLFVPPVKYIQEYSMFTQELIIAYFDTSGEAYWVQKPVVEKTAVGIRLKIDKKGNFLLNGNFSGNPSNSSVLYLDTLVLKTNGNNGSTFLAKLNPDKLMYRRIAYCGYDSLFITSPLNMFDSVKWERDNIFIGEGRKMHIPNPGGKAYKLTITGYSVRGITVLADSLFPKLPVPVAKFYIEADTACQWVQVHFKNSSVTDTIHPQIPETWWWDFGDGTTDTSRNPVHIFSKPGAFNVRLAYSNGFCTDTFALTQKINILPAPKPGFSVSAIEGCVPLKVDLSYLYTDETKSATFYSGNGDSSINNNASFFYSKPGIYTIRQVLYGKSGCITKDSIQINVRPSFEQGNIPELIVASVENTGEVTVKWKKDSVSKTYLLHRKSPTTNTTYNIPAINTFFTDSAVSSNKESYEYFLQGIDSCGSLSEKSNIAKTILLKTENVNNKHAVLKWNAYEEWNSGVETYNIEVKKDINDSFQIVDEFPGQLYEYPFDDTTEKICFRITAIKKGNSQLRSYSNLACVELNSVLFIPNSFTPNDDGVNDNFEIKGIGIEKLDIQIFNRWGQLVFKSDKKNKAWDGTFNGSLVELGVYVYRMEATAKNGEKFYNTGSVTVLK